VDCHFIGGFAFFPAVLPVLQAFFLGISMSNPLSRVFVAASLIMGGVPPAMCAQTLMVSDQMSATHPGVRSVEFMGQLVAQRTSGALQVAVKPNGALGNENDSLKAVGSGKLAMVRTSLTLLGDRSAAAAILSLPYLLRSRDHLWKVLNGDLGKRLDAELAQAGFIRLMYLDTGTRNFYCRKPVKTLADFSKLKIRIPASNVFTDVVRDLGAQPTSMPINQVDAALKSGAIDCAEGTAVNFVETGHYKSVTYFMQDGHWLTPDVLLISKVIWDKLPPAQQNALRSSAAEATNYMIKLSQEQENSAMASLKKSGVTVIPNSQMSMTGIESSAMKSYSKYVKTTKDLQTIAQISLIK
jgi:TRAP-type transport system periplasmic protein